MKNYGHKLTLFGKLANWLNHPSRLKVDRLIADLHRKKDEPWKIKRKLIKMGSISVDPLIKILNSEGDSFVKWQAAKALASIGDSRAIPSLVGMLNDHSLVRYANNGDNAYIYQVAIEALSAMGRPGLDSLIKALGNPSSSRHVRLLVAMELGSIGDTRAIPALTKACQVDDDLAVRSRASSALESIRLVRKGI